MEIECYATDCIHCFDERCLHSTIIIDCEHNCNCFEKMED